nr:hypothetical protein [Tanacetum cinerariifolium]
IKKAAVDIVRKLTGSGDDSNTSFPALSWFIGERKVNEASSLSLALDFSGVVSQLMRGCGGHKSK